MTAAYAPSAPAKRIVASTARAAAIVEQVARKHDLAPNVVLCARWDRFALAARAEAAHELREQLNWSLRRIGERLGCSHANVRKLLGLHQMNLKRGRRWLPAADLQALAQLEGEALGLRVIEAEERATYLQQEIDRLSGRNRALELSEALGVRLRGGILLAIVAEAWPRAALGQNILELYDDACAHLGYGDQAGASYNLMVKNVAHLREHFAANGWPDPIVMNDKTPTGALSGSRRLSDDAALFLHERFGVPSLSAVEAWRERSGGAATGQSASVHTQGR